MALAVLLVIGAVALCMISWKKMASESKVEANHEHASSVLSGEHQPTTGIWISNLAEDRSLQTSLAEATIASLSSIHSGEPIAVVATTQSGQTCLPEVKEALSRRGLGDAVHVVPLTADADASATASTIFGSMNDIREACAVAAISTHVGPPYEDAVAAYVLAYRSDSALAASGAADMDGFAWLNELRTKACIPTFSLISLRDAGPQSSVDAHATKAIRETIESMAARSSTDLKSSTLIVDDASSVFGAAARAATRIEGENFKLKAREVIDVREASERHFRTGSLGVLVFAVARVVKEGRPAIVVSALASDRAEMYVVTPPPKAVATDDFTEQRTTAHG